MKRWYAIQAHAEGATIAIHDEIGAHGVTAKAFLADLAALPDAAPLEVRINSPGGSVFDAVAIHNGLKRHAGPVTVRIDGIAASAASYVAMAGDVVAMPANAFLMIHDPTGLVVGTAGDMRAMAEALEKIKASLVAGYAAKAGAPEADIAALMAAETWLDAEEALALGFADRLEEPVRIAAGFDLGRFRNAPDDARALAELPASAEADAGARDATDAADAAEAAGTRTTDRQTEEEVMTDPETPAPPAGGADPDTPSADPPATAAIADPAARARAQGQAKGEAQTRTEARAEALVEARAEALAVVDLCALAGRPDLAAGFLADGRTPDEVRARLLELRAGATAEIDGRHARTAATAASAANGARPWGEVIAGAFKRSANHS